MASGNGENPRGDVRLKTGKSGRLGAAIVVMFLFAAMACGGPDAEVPAPAADSPGGQISMGGNALGGNAETVVLAQLVLEELPPGPVAWVTHRFELPQAGTLEHQHATAFVYAVEGGHVLNVGGDSRSLAQGEGAALRADAGHRHDTPGGPSVFWETRLEPTGAAVPTDAAATVFESELLEDIPELPLAVFVRVVVPPDGETSVHTHPGNEFIYQETGRIDYQNGLIGVRPMAPGDYEGIPREVSVQKRNPHAGAAVFLSWFLVDQDRPFASPAVFVTNERGQNLALLGNGASVSAVSSNYGGGDDDSSFGAMNALDGNPATEWSSAGEGDDAWIEVALPSLTQVTSVGFWTRTMGNSAQVSSFQVTTDQGDVYGPFTVDDATTIYYFDTSFEAKTLRFELLDTSGGNTGALEIEVYGEPVG